MIGDSKLQADVRAGPGWDPAGGATHTGVAAVAEEIEVRSAAATAWAAPGTASVRNDIGRS